MNAPLPRLQRPRAETTEISDLLDEAIAGRYALPDFQRDLQWDKEDRIKLFDSIYRGFPIGDILLWDPETTRAGKIKFGPFEPAKRATSCLLIVDGQQRLATLFGCLLLPEPTANDPFTEWRFAFDTDRKEIVDLSTEMPSRALLPLPVAIDTSKYLKWTRNLPEERWNERTQAGDDFSKALRTYRVPFYVVRTQDRKLLEEVFERVNNTGRALKRTDVFNALFPGTTEEDDRRVKLESIATELDAKDFGHIKADWLVQAIKAMVGMDPAAEFSTQLRQMDEKDKHEGTPGKTRSALGTIHAPLRDAATRAIDFLQQAGIRHVSTVPYALLFPPLVHFFDRFSEPLSSKSIGNLKRFVWFVSVSGARHLHRSAFQRKAATSTRDARDSEEASAELAKVTAIDVKEAPRGKTLVSHHDWSTGATRVVALAMFALQPRDLESGEIIPVWDELLRSGGQPPFRTLWPQGTGSWATSTANRMLAPNSTTRNLGLQLEELAKPQMFDQPVDLELLAGHCITAEAWAELQKGNRLGFLELREKRIAEVVDDFVKQQLR